MKKTKTKDNLDGNNALYIRFKSYNFKHLKKVIKLANNNFYFEKSKYVHGYSKNMGSYQ